ncbi:hypothetical protein P152DRAFT_454952 [Eremomyces bilateralis CBS 781.70]|uniref:Uncharacterized protein n=1 Tax=Eremomyces bilateralis CBS 781.70 TaxID=1392243 RepID=A0A6G1GF96_9PEZI|nr:uncharacterized protein P152DRAFT_454952 [Eremomyces bilateralis CBS 781.70]KAF1816723.1 hypothetical protein P152DRAFT_454952 [Eremomyces bilateralis CBS 781.70]
MASYLNYVTSNYSLSLLSIPAYHVLALLPHFYSFHLGTQGDSSKWRNANSRGQTHAKEIQTRLSPAQYNRFERARAAHANAMENLPLFVAAVLASKFVAIAKGESVGESLGTDALAVRLLLARAVYTAMYLFVKDDRVAGLRTLVWLYGVQQCWKSIIGAAWALAH